MAAIGDTSAPVVKPLVDDGTINPLTIDNAAPAPMVVRPPADATPAPVAAPTPSVSHLFES